MCDNCEEKMVKVELELDEETAKELQKGIEKKNAPKKEKEEDKNPHKQMFDIIQASLVKKSIEFLKENDEEMTLSGLLAALVSIVDVVTEKSSELDEDGKGNADMRARLALILNKAARCLVKDIDL